MIVNELVTAILFVTTMILSGVGIVLLEKTKRWSYLMSVPFLVISTIVLNVQVDSSAEAITNKAHLVFVENSPFLWVVIAVSVIILSGENYLISKDKNKEKVND